jgi:hypothetical protein
MKDRPADLIIDKPEQVALKIGDLITSGDADISV